MRNIANEKPNLILHGRPLATVGFVSDQDIKDKDVLDIGCGYGWCELNFLARGAKTVTGTEIADQDLSTAKENIVDPRANFLVGSALSLPFPDKSFDTVVCWEVVEHLPKGSENIFFQEAKRVLRDGGSFYLSTPNAHILSKLGDPAFFVAGHRHYKLEELNVFGENNGFGVVASKTMGGAWETLNILNMYISKWALRRSPLFQNFFNQKIDSEYKKDGFYGAFIHYQKQENLAKHEEKGHNEQQITAQTGNAVRFYMKKALITGITGQDGSYLAEFLLSKGYEVHGIIRRASTFNTGRIDHLLQDTHEKNVKLFLHYGDLSDSGNIEKVINETQPDEIYNLGAQSHVRVSFDMPEFTSNVDGLGVLRVLEAIKNSGRKIKFYQASSSEMFGAANPPQNELTPFQPQSPYACAKVFAYYITQLYRKAYGIFACNGILFNHESPRRGETFVTRKIAKGVARIKAGLDKKIYLGNLDSKRDWGYAKEYVEAMWLMLQQESPDDYVVATGETHTVKEFLDEAFKVAGLGDWHEYVEIDPRYYRPAEVDALLGDASKAKEKLNWEPKVTFKELTRMMVEAELKELNIL